MKWTVLTEGGSLKLKDPATIEVDAKNIHTALCATNVPWGTVTAIVRKDIWDELQKKEVA